jgi:alkylation response protein AidB-like acyl-CoA dehydrogenase
LDAATNTWSVSGFKWFSSATTADMTMLLARTIDPKDGTVKTVKLAFTNLFYQTHVIFHRELEVSLSLSCRNEKTGWLIEWCPCSSFEEQVWY